jgi:acyl-CoA thioesterase-1
MRAADAADAVAAGNSVKATLLIMALAWVQASDSRPIILAFGDSLTAGYGVAAGFGYPEQLQKKLEATGYKYRVVNMGLSGDTTSGGRSRMNRALALNPSIVILEFGGNDTSNGLTPAQTENNLDRMITAFKSGGATVILAGRMSARTDEVLGKLAKKYQIRLISSFLEGVAGKPNLTIGDGVHPNADGYTLVVNNVMKTIEPLLKR